MSSRPHGYAQWQNTRSHDDGLDNQHLMNTSRLHGHYQSMACQRNVAPGKIILNQTAVSTSLQAHLDGAKQAAEKVSHD